MRILLPAIFFLLITLGFAGCSRQLPASQTTTPASVEAAPTNKVGKTTKTGVVSKANGKYYLQVSNQPLLEIDSYSIDLSDFPGKTVTVTGEYSGNTLFVGEIN